MVVQNILLNIYENKNWRLIFPGGYFHEDTLMFERPEGIEKLKDKKERHKFLTDNGYKLKT